MQRSILRLGRRLGSLAGATLLAAAPLSLLAPQAAQAAQTAQPVLLQASLDYVGLGVSLGPDAEGQGYRVVGVIDTAPEKVRTSVKKDDLLTHVDGMAIKGIALGDVVTLIRGPEGSKVKLTLVRAGEEKPLEVELTRTAIKVKPQ